MLNEKILKIICAFLAFVMILIFGFFSVGTEKIIPENPINKNPGEPIFPEVVYGANGMNELPNEEKTENDSEEEPEENKEENLNSDAQKESQDRETPVDRKSVV